MTIETQSIKDVARIAGISVRALHHYDHLGLLVPRRTAAGYRIYSDADLVRLQQILIHRALGLPLAEIKRSLDDPAFDLRSALLRQRAALATRAEQTLAMVRTLDTTLAALPPTTDTPMIKMSKDERLSLFDGFDPQDHEAEAEQRWGATAAYAESARRTAQYTPEDWARHTAESDAIMNAAAVLFQSGAAPSGTHTAAVVERHRDLIDRWFYPCDAQMHAKLADMYDADPRFAANIDKYADGLTPWWAAAIRSRA